MKNRDYKNFVQGGVYHLFNRGNGKMDIFKDDQDYVNFLKRIRLTLGLSRMTLDNYASREAERIRINPLPKDALFILTYVLMPNHFHFIITQNSSVSLGKFIHKVCTSYSMYFSKKYKHVGNLFQDQFKAVNITSDEQLLWLSAYIHLNPIKAGLVDNLTLYRWSSYSEYKNNTDGIWNKDFFKLKFGSSEKFLDNTLGNFEVNSINDSLTLE